MLGHAGHRTSPRPQELEEKPARSLQAKRFSKHYWLYVVVGALIAAGFADFALIAFHFQKAAIVAQSTIPVFYAVAMASGALSSLFFGRLLDKLGLPILLLALLLSALGFYSPDVHKEALGRKLSLSIPSF